MRRVLVTGIPSFASDHRPWSAPTRKASGPTDVPSRSAAHEGVGRLLDRGVLEHGFSRARPTERARERKLKAMCTITSSPRLLARRHRERWTRYSPPRLVCFEVRAERSQ